MDQPTHVLDPDGEVIIILRDANSPFAPASENPPGTFDETSVTNAAPHPPVDIATPRIQVSAKYLTFASSVFKSMLTGGFKESKDLSQNGSVEITAQDWDVEALLVVLRAIHGQYISVPQKLTLEMLAKVAVIADYYQCKEALFIITDKWINNLEEKIPTTFSRDLIMWLWISWFFQLSSQFKEATLAAVSWSQNTIDAWGLPVPKKVIGKFRSTFYSKCLASHEITDSLNFHRITIIGDMVTRIHRVRQEFLDGSRG